MKRMAWIGLVLLAFCLPTRAEMPEALVKQIETSMLVSGSVDIAPDGTATGIHLDQIARLPPGVVQLVESAAAQWRFEPVLVGGAAAAVRASMQLRVVARAAGEGTYSISLHGASFANAPDDSAVVRSRRMTPPDYPQRAYGKGFQGVAYLVLRIGRDGHVEDVFPEQVNLTVYGTPEEMEAARKDFATASVRAARKWTFSPPTSGAAVDEPHWHVRVPVAYEISDTPRRSNPQAGYGPWEAYLPGPRQAPPWMDAADRATAADMVADGQLQMVGGGPRLLTPVQG